MNFGWGWHCNIIFCQKLETRASIESNPDVRTTTMIVNNGSTQPERRHEPKYLHWPSLNGFCRNSPHALSEWRGLLLVLLGVEVLKQLLTV